MSEITLVEVGAEPIELCKLLKIADLVGGGGEAKIVISEGYVYLNGEVEYQKRKKIYDGDFVEFNETVIQLSVDPSLAEEIIETEPKPAPIKPKKSAQNKKKAKNKSKNEQATKANNSSSELNVTKRRPINF